MILKKKSVIEPHGSIWDSVQQKAKDQTIDALNGRLEDELRAICMVVLHQAQQAKLEK